MLPKFDTFHPHLRVAPCAPPSPTVSGMSLLPRKISGTGPQYQAQGTSFSRFPLGRSGSAGLGSGDAAVSHKAPTLPYARSLGPRRAEPGTGRRRTPPGGLTERVPEQPAEPAHRGTDHTVALSAEVWDVPAPGIPGTRAVPSPPRDAGIGFGRTAGPLPSRFALNRPVLRIPRPCQKLQLAKNARRCLRQSSDLQCRRRDDGTRTTLGSATPLHPLIFRPQTSHPQIFSPLPPDPSPYIISPHSDTRPPQPSTLGPLPHTLQISKPSPEIFSPWIPLQLLHSPDTSPAAVSPPSLAPDPFCPLYIQTFSQHSSALCPLPWKPPSSAKLV